MKLIKMVSTATDGNMSFKWGKREEVVENRKKFLARLGIKYEECVFASLLSRDGIKIVGPEDRTKMYECDALVTSEMNVGLVMVTADCLPVVMWDLEKQVLALVHLGWRGVDLRLAQKTVKQMQELGAQADKIQVWVGPGARKDSYIKYGEKLAEFWQNINPVNAEEWKKYVTEMREKDKFQIDLVGFTEKQLEDMGVKLTNIETSKIDTIVDENYFSHYRSSDLGEAEGRFATVAIFRQNG